MSAGSFGWLELISPDLASAQSFYTSLLGWTLRTEDMNGEPYTFAVAGETNVAGFDTSDTSNAPPHWLPYIQVPTDLESAIEAIEAGGGQVFRTMDLPDDVRFATCADPDGAIFCPIQEMDAGSAKPVNWPPDLGTVSWYALSASNAERAVTFYRSVFGYNAPDAPADIEAPAGYTVLQTGEDMYAGVFSHGGTLPSNWLPYFVVADIEAAQQNVVSLGGAITTPIMAVPGIGRIVGAIDPQGAPFCLHQYQE
jgi:predicted enzyme related to lactoylglutathione lyase